MTVGRKSEQATTGCCPLSGLCLLLFDVATPHDDPPSSGGAHDTSMTPHDYSRRRSMAAVPGWYPQVQLSLSLERVQVSLLEMRDVAAVRSHQCTFLGRFDAIINRTSDKLF